MSCNRRLQARIPYLVAGELDPIRFWLLRRHIATCPACRAQTERTQNLLSGLAALATAPTTDAMRARVFDQLAPIPTPMPSPLESDHAVEAPAIGQQGVSPLRIVWTVSRRRLLPFIALLAVVVAGTAPTGYLFGWHDSRPMKDRSTTNWSWYSDLGGRIWYLSGNFEGVLRLESGDNIITTWQRSGAGLGQGEIRVTLDGRTYRVLKIGSHEIRDDAGKLLGRLHLETGSPLDVLAVQGTGRLQSRTCSEQARLEAEATRRALEAIGASGGVSIGQGGSVGTISVTSGSNIRYQTHGTCTLRLTTPTRAKPFYEETRFDEPAHVDARTHSIAPPQIMTAASPRSRLSAVSRTTPLDVEVRFKGHTLRARRYGKYSLTVDHFNTVLIVEISPPVGSAVPRR